MGKPSPLSGVIMFLIFLVASIATLLILSGRRTAGIVACLLTIATLAGLLAHHMTDKLPISL